MATTARTARTASTVAKKTAPATPKAPKATEAPVSAVLRDNGHLDLAALAGAAQTVAEPPKPARSGGGGGAFAVIVKASLDEDAWKALPAVPADKVTALRNALRRAAMAQGFGLEVRPSDPDAAGMVIVNFKAKPEPRKAAS